MSFPNGDPFLHNVFSPTSERTFDLGSYKQGDTRTRTFPKRGVVDIYCNIHPEMSATLIVLPNTRYAIRGYQRPLPDRSRPSWHVDDVRLFAAGTSSR